MTIPDKIKIGALMMNVVYDEHLASSNERFGECDTMRARIVIDSMQPKDHMELTLIHEIIEKINLENELRLEHPQISCLTNALYQVLSDNNMLK